MKKKNVSGTPPPADNNGKTGRILELLQARYPHPQTHLHARGAWELLVATILAAQCTDARVNIVTPGLFRRWPGPADMSGADVGELEDCIRSTGFFHNKARHLIDAARRICDAYAGKVPDRMEELITLPGVARKTANVVLWGAFGKNEGIAVDTHVGRIAYRLGLASGKDPAKTEKELMNLFPREEWGDLNHRLVWFGRDICQARKPLCSQCELYSICERRGVTQSG